MKKIFWIIIIVVVTIGVVWAFAGSKEHEYVVRIGYLPNSTSLSFKYAEEKGYFQDAGIKVQGVEIQTSNQLFEAIARGDVDVTPQVSLIPSLAGEIVDKGKFKIYSVTDAISAEPFDSILVKVDSTIKSVGDLKGKKIGVFPGSTATAFMKKYLSDRKVDISATQFVQLPPTNQLTALSAGSIDALFAYEPAVTIAVQSGVAKVLSGSVFSSFLEHNPLGVGVISTKFITEHPELADEVVKVFDRANTNIKSNSSFRDVAAKAYNIDPKVAAVFSHSYMTTSTSIDKEVFNKFVDILLSLGELKEKPDLSNIFYK